MNGFPGKLIVIDGTDGSGKTTQLNLLKLKLEADGHIVEVADFPQYNTKSAGLVEEYLSGKYGNADEVNAYKASIFFAIDRYDASFKIRRWLTEGKIVLSNRYTSGNLGHQGCKIENPLERKVFFNWLYDLEYKIFEIPKPDLSIILHVEADIAQRLAKTRSREDWSGKSKDIHEDDLNHLKKAEQVYLEIARSFPDFKLINCTRNNELLAREEIHFLISLSVNRIINSEEKMNIGLQSIATIIEENRPIGALSPLSASQPMAFTPPANTESPAVSTLAISRNESLSEQNIKIIIEKINDQAKMPAKMHVGDAGYDLYANDYYSIAPYGQALVATGIKMTLPAGYAGLIWDKSGLASEGLTTMGGVIDSSYRGELKVIFKNLSEDIYNIIPGQKIAQLLIQKITATEINSGLVETDSSRGEGGFGSTGKF